MFAVETYAAVRAAFNVALRFFGASPVNLARETRIAPRGEGPHEFPQRPNLITEWDGRSRKRVRPQLSDENRMG
jgi:hypothetical protein